MNTADSILELAIGKGAIDRLVRVNPSVHNVDDGNDAESVVSLGAFGLDERDEPDLCGHYKDLLGRVEKMTEGDDIAKLTTFPGELTNACVRFHDSDGGSRNSDGYKIMIEKLVAVIEKYEKVKTALLR